MHEVYQQLAIQSAAPTIISLSFHASCCTYDFETKKNRHDDHQLTVTNRLDLGQFLSVPVENTIDAVALHSHRTIQES